MLELDDHGSGRLQLPELSVGVRRFGDPEGPKVLGLHGWLDNANTWTGIAPFVPELDLVSMDMPGHGFSDYRAQAPYHFVDMIADAIAAADALGWERFSLLGHSMGAGVSTLVAGTVPDRIEKLALVEGLGPLVDVEDNAPARLARSIRTEARKRTSEKRIYESPADATARLAEATNMLESSAATLVERGLVEREEGWQWRADPRLRVDSRLRMTERQVHAFLKEISAPTMLVFAEKGWPYDEEAMRGRVDAVSEMEVVRLPGHHHLHLDTPEPVAQNLRRHLVP